MNLSDLGLGANVTGIAESTAQVLPPLEDGGIYSCRWVSCKKKELSGNLILEASLIVDADDNGKTTFLNETARVETTPNGTMLDEHGSRRFMKLYNAYGIPFKEGELPIIEFESVTKLTPGNIIQEVNKNIKVKVEIRTKGDKRYINASSYIVDDVNETPANSNTDSDGVPDLG